jgi:hypothetical protein
MTVMAAGGRPTPKAQVLQPRATYRCAELMDRDLLSLPLAASRHPSASPMSAQRGNCDANAIRHAVRPVVARQRHRTPLTGSGGRRQQADRVPDAPGQSRQGSNERQTRRRVFEDRWATSHGVGTLLAWKPVTSVRLGTPDILSSSVANSGGDVSKVEQDLLHAAGRIANIFFKGVGKMEFVSLPR